MVRISAHAGFSHHTPSAIIVISVIILIIIYIAINTITIIVAIVKIVEKILKGGFLPAFTLLSINLV